MQKTFGLVMAVMVGIVALGGCAPLIGAAGVIVVDESMERDRGGDGLF